MEQILKSRYKIAEKISENNFSVTYRGTLIGSDKAAIIKIYKRGTLSSTLIQQMKRKVKEFGRITHHGVAKLLDGDYGWQGFYYVREMIDGASLQEMLSRGEKLGVEKACDIMDQALAALSAVHSKGIIHAALKPSNIFIDGKGLVRLADFVIVGEVKESLPQKIHEIMSGSQYASPEELRGMPITAASDIYSLGLVFYQLAAGKPLSFNGSLAGNLQKMKGKPLFRREDLCSLPRFAADIVLRATEKDPILRFASAEEFRESIVKKNVSRRLPSDNGLMEIFERTVTQYGGEELAKTEEPPHQVGKIQWRKEKHRSWILAGILAIAVAAGIIYAFIFGR